MGAKCSFLATHKRCDTDPTFRVVDLVGARIGYRRTGTAEQWAISHECLRNNIVSTVTDGALIGAVHSAVSIVGFAMAKLDCRRGRRGYGGRGGRRIRDGGGGGGGRAGGRDAGSRAAGFTLHLDRRQHAIPNDVDSLTGFWLHDTVAELVAWLKSTNSGHILKACITVGSLVAQRFAE